jgi:hypothetical protein
LRLIQNSFIFLSGPEKPQEPEVAQPCRGAHGCKNDEYWKVDGQKNVAHEDYLRLKRSSHSAAPNFLLISGGQTSLISGDEPGSSLSLRQSSSQIATSMPHA